jgi:hypothetical protein
VVATVSFFATTNFREDVVEDEFRMRIEPSLAAIQAAARDLPKEAYIVTLEPLIPQMYAKSEVDVLSLDDLDATVMKKIGFFEGATNALYLDEQIHRSPADAERYRSQLEYLNHFQRTTLLSDDVFSVVRISDVDEVGTHSEAAVDNALNSSWCKLGMGVSLRLN